MSSPYPIMQHLCTDSNPDPLNIGCTLDCSQQAYSCEENATISIQNAIIVNDNEPFKLDCDFDVEVPTWVKNTCIPSVNFICEKGLGQWKKNETGEIVCNK